jgi:hypothetical protein
MDSPHVSQKHARHGAPGSDLLKPGPTNQSLPSFARRTAEGGCPHIKAYSDWQSRISWMAEVMMGVG